MNAVFAILTAVVMACVIGWIFSNDDDGTDPRRKGKFSKDNTNDR